ncbi:MAG TPA: 2'-5' RNA ligase family protein [Pseudomonadales bacterium]|nr:2'-5' RNA ligase family protein [Pseudomonadales bacterium]
MLNSNQKTASEFAIYEKLWSDALHAFEQGQPQVDPHLSNKANDSRRGVTLVIRPSQSVRDAVAAFIDRLAAVCPGQYYYRPEELHLTVLSAFSGTEHWQQEMERIPACRQVISDVLKTHRPFKIKLHSVTASPGAILIQGFPADNTLATIRNELRDAFAQNGLGDMLDRRYKITGAHMTIMRFHKADGDLHPLIAFLKENRETAFGECEIHNLQLIFNDWYASAETVQVLEEYQLPAP